MGNLVPPADPRPASAEFDGRSFAVRVMMDLDDDLLASAEAELGTVGAADTVRAALDQVASRGARAREIRWLIEGGLTEMSDSGARSAVWR